MGGIKLLALGGRRGQGTAAGKKKTRTVGSGLSRRLSSSESIPLCRPAAFRKVEYTQRSSKRLQAAFCVCNVRARGPLFFRKIVSSGEGFLRIFAFSFLRPMRGRRHTLLIILFITLLPAGSPFWHPSTVLLHSYPITMSSSSSSTSTSTTTGDAAAALEFLRLAGKLKGTVRTGWVYSGVG